MLLTCIIPRPPRPMALMLRRTLAMPQVPGQGKDSRPLSSLYCGLGFPRQRLSNLVLLLLLDPVDMEPVKMW